MFFIALSKIYWESRIENQIKIHLVALDKNIMCCKYCNNICCIKNILCCSAERKFVKFKHKSKTSLLEFCNKY